MAAAAVLNALAPAATVAQLGGADAAGLVSAILQAVRTARRNRRECRLLARRVMMVGDLLRLLPPEGSGSGSESETMRRPEVRRALDGLGGALRQALQLVESCQESGAVRGFISAGRQAEQLREVQGEINDYMLLFPVVSHIDITRRLDLIYSMLIPPPDSQHRQVPEDLPSSPAFHFGAHARNEEITTTEVVLFDGNKTITELLEVDQYQITGHQDGVEEFLTGYQMFKWLCWWPQEAVSRHAPVQPECSVYNLLKNATNNFSSENKIGYGGHATIYKGHIREGLEVAIKRYSEASSHGVFDEYEHESHILTELHHPNIIKLLGRYTGQGERILVYEYMSNGSLDKFISGRGLTLDWSSRFRIIEGIMQGLLYIHAHSDGHIVHRDVKPHNILLDSDMNAKISDFGLAIMLWCEQQQVNVIPGTFGYLAPEYCLSGILSTKVDIYALGITLLEIIAAKRWFHLCPKGNISMLPSNSEMLDSSSNDTLPSNVMLDLPSNGMLPYAWDLWRTGRSIELLDPSSSLSTEHQTTEVTRCIQIALLCAQTDAADRPPMEDVIAMLSSDNINLPEPKQPDFHQASAEAEDIACDHSSWTSSDLTLPR